MDATSTSSKRRPNFRFGSAKKARSQQLAAARTRRQAPSAWRVDIPTAADETSADDSCHTACQTEAPRAESKLVALRERDVNIPKGKQYASNIVESSHMKL